MHDKNPQLWSLFLNRDREESNLNQFNKLITLKNILICLISLASCKVSFLQLTKSKHFVFSTDCSFCEYMDLLGDCNCDDVNWCREVQCTVAEKCDEACKNFVIHLLLNN